MKTKSETLKETPQAETPAEALETSSPKRLKKAASEVLQGLVDEVNSQAMKDSPAKVKLSLPLTKEDRARLTEFIAEAEERFDFQRVEDDKKRKVLELFEKLQKDVQELEASFDGTDEATLVKLTSKKQQLAVASNRITATPTKRDAQNEFSEWHKSSLRFFEFLRPFLIVCLEELKEEITRKLIPYYQDDGYARNVAGSTHAYVTYQAWLQSHLIRVGRPKESVEAMVAVGKAMLAGEVFWTFYRKVSTTFN